MATPPCSNAEAAEKCAQVSAGLARRNGSLPRCGQCAEWAAAVPRCTGRCRRGSSPFRRASAERAALLEHVAGRILASGSGRLRVAIDGRTAAGKTSFGHELAERLSTVGRPVLRASLDDFKKPWSDRHLYDRESGEGYYRNAFDYATVRRLLLEPAAAAGSGDCVLCSIDPLTQIDHSAVIARAAPDAVLIVDGVFASAPSSSLPAARDATRRGLGGLPGGGRAPRPLSGRRAHLPRRGRSDSAGRHRDRQLVVRAPPDRARWLRFWAVPVSIRGSRL
jgi:hypothetical protein